MDKIDILSIDTEGTELEVWSTLTILKPQVVIIEYLSQGVKNDKLDEVFGKDYERVLVTESNYIYKLK